MQSFAMLGPLMLFVANRNKFVNYFDKYGLVSVCMNNLSLFSSHKSKEKYHIVGAKKAQMCILNF